MKRFVLFALLHAILWCAAADYGFAQNNYKASAGISAAKKQSSLTGAEINTIITIGDTTLTSQLGVSIPSLYAGLIGFKDNGTSALWLYNVKGKANNVDTTKSLLLVNIALTSFFALPLPLPSIPNNPFSTDTVLPAQFMDSDVMYATMKANATFKAYKAKHPDLHLSVAALGMSAGGALPKGPVWTILNVTKDTDAPFTCFVSAADNNGQCVCLDVPTSVNEATTIGNESAISLYPTPASSSLNLHIPIELYSPDVHLALYNPIGEKVKDLPLQSVAGGVNILIPTADLPTGAYFLQYHTAAASKMLPFSVVH